MSQNFDARKKQLFVTIFHDWVIQHIFPSSNKNETELDRWTDFRPAEEVLNPLLLWIAKAENPKSKFLKLAKLALHVFSIPAMSS